MANWFGKIRKKILASAIFVLLLTSCEYNGYVPVDSPPADLLMFALLFEGNTPIIGIPIDPVYRLPDGVTYNNSDRINSCISAEDGPIEDQYLSYIVDDQYPKLAGIEIPEEIEINQRFEIKLTAATSLSEVKSVLVLVKGASRYYDIPAENIDGNTITLNPKLLSDARLLSNGSSKNYSIRFALMDENGKFGNCYEGSFWVLPVNSKPSVKLDGNVEDITAGEEIHLMQYVLRIYDPDADPFDCEWLIEEYEQLVVNGEGEEEYQLVCDSEFIDKDRDGEDDLINCEKMDLTAMLAQEEGKFREGTITLQDGDKVEVVLTCTDDRGESNDDSIKLSTE